MTSSLLLVVLVAGLLVLRGSPRGRGWAPAGRIDASSVSAPVETGPVLPTPIRLELIGAMLDSGLSVSRAVQTMAEVEGTGRLAGVARLLEMGLDWDAAWAAGEATGTGQGGETGRAGALGPGRGGGPAHHSSRAAETRGRGARRLPGGSRLRPSHGRTGASRAAEELRDLHRLRESLEFAVHTGAPAASLLRAQASRLRRQRHRDGEKRAAALGVRLMLPLGACSLPAFVCLGVVPVLIGLVPTLW